MTDRMTLDQDAQWDLWVQLTEEEVSALLLEFDHVYVRRGALRTAIRKLTALYPHLCTYCHTTTKVGTHNMALCTDASGARIKRENSE